MDNQKAYQQSGDWISIKVDELSRLRAEVEKLRKIAEHVATDGARITPELVVAARAALNQARKGE